MNAFSELPMVVLIGAIVGLLPGLFGVGGGFVTVPALFLLAQVPIDIAVGSSACQVLGPATTGLSHRWHRGSLQWRMPLSMFGGNTVGLWLGLLFVDWAGTRDEMWELFGRSVPRLETVMMICYLGLLLSLSAIVAIEWFFAGGTDDTTRRGWLEAWRIPPLGRFPELGGRQFSLPILATLGVLVGFLNGGMGMGGGIVLLPALIFLVGLSTSHAVTVSLVLTWLGAIGASIGHADRGNVNLWLVGALLAGGTIGGKLGSVLGERIGGRKLRGYFALVILFVAFVIGSRLYRLLWG